MIYNLYEYAKANIASVIFIVDGWEVADPEESVLLSQSGGDPGHWFPRHDYTVQLISRACTKVKSRKNLYKVYALLLNKYGCVLPESEITDEDGDTEIFPAITAAQMSPIQDPGYLGVDENKRHLYSYNLKVTVGG